MTTDTAQRECRDCGTPVTFGYRCKDCVTIPKRDGYATPTPDDPPMGHPDDEPEPGASWQPVDLTETVAGILAGTIARPQPTIGARDDGRCLFYRGRVNGVAGAANSGKSWTGLAASAQQIPTEHVVYVDLEDDEIGTVGRLLDLGVAPADILGRFHYIHPHEKYSAAARERLAATVTRYSAVLVVVDSTGESMALDGSKPNDDDDVARWFRKLPRAVAALGPAVLVLDHIPKADDGGMAPIGSQRKKAAITGAQYIQATVRAFSRDTAGMAKLTCVKDRHGNYHQGEKVAELHFTPTGDGTTVELRAPAEANAGGVFRPTTLMERASKVIEAAPKVNIRGLDSAMGGNKDNVAAAVRVLVSEGYVKVDTGARNALEHTSVTPYRQASDPLSDACLSPGTVDPPNTPKQLSTVPPLLGGGDRGTVVDRPSGTVEGQSGTVANQGVRDLSTTLTATVVSGPCVRCDAPHPRYGAGGRPLCDTCEAAAS